MRKKEPKGRIEWVWVGTRGDRGGKRGSHESFKRVRRSCSKSRSRKSYVRATSARYRAGTRKRETKRERASFLVPIKERRPRENFNNPRFAGVCQYLNNVPWDIASHEWSPRVVLDVTVNSFLVPRVSIIIHPPRISSNVHFFRISSTY